MGTLELNNNGWISVPWAEFVGKDGSHGSSFSSGWNDDSQAVFNILVYFEDALQAEQDILGISFFDGTSLSRTPPVQHPYRWQMRAEKIIAAHPLRFDGKEIVDFPNAAFGVGGSTSAYSTYDYMMLSIGFATPKYAILSDTEIQSAGGLEYLRWCEVDEDQHIETITREQGEFVWLTNSNPSRVGQIFNAPIGQHL